MKKIKRLLVSFLFTKKQREFIQQAIIYSEYKYRKRGNVEKAAEAHSVLNETMPILGVIAQTYTKEEVDTIVGIMFREQKQIIDNEVKKAFKAGAESVLKQMKVVGVAVPACSHEEESEKEEEKTDSAEQENSDSTQHQEDNEQSQQVSEESTTEEK